jgi:CHRD domain/FG-GAP-like repeat
MKLVRFLILVASALVLSATVNAEAFSAYLSSAQEVPTNSSTATGYARVVLNESAGTISFTVVFSGLSSNQAACHIHASAAIGANAPVAINLGAVGGTSGTITGTAAITPTQVAQLRAHQTYVNVHSANFAGGEIRGQLAIRRLVDFDGDGREDYSVIGLPSGGQTNSPFRTQLSSGGQQLIELAVPFEYTTDSPAPGDYDGDGKDDYAIYRTTDNTSPNVPSQFWIFRSSDNVLQNIFYGRGGDQEVNRDYDGDGKTDIAIFRRGVAPGDQAYWWIRLSTSGIETIGNDTVIPFGTTGRITRTSYFGDEPVPGDYDGDGKFDLAVYRFGGIAPNNNYIIRRSSDNTVTFTQFGNYITDFIVPGDYDGDGKYDLAVARLTSTMQWWILESSTNTIRFELYGKSNGSNSTATDKPIQGDYDGDGKTDIAVYRIDTIGNRGRFWVLNSFTNSTTTFSFGSFDSKVVNNFDAH